MRWGASVVIVLGLAAIGGASEAIAAICGPHAYVFRVDYLANGRKMTKCKCQAGYVPIAPELTVWGKPPQWPGCRRAANATQRVDRNRGRKRYPGQYQAEPAEDPPAVRRGAHGGRNRAALGKSAADRDAEKNRNDGTARRDKQVIGRKAPERETSPVKREPPVATREAPKQTPKTTLGATQPTRSVSQPDVSTPPVAAKVEHRYPEVPVPRIGADSWGEGFADKKNGAVLNIDKAGLERLPRSNSQSAKWAGEDGAGSSGSVKEFMRLRKLTFGETWNKLKKFGDAWKSEDLTLLFTVVSVKAAECAAGVRRDCEDIDKANERFSEKHLQRGKIKNFFKKDDGDKNEKK